jgi:hypothetical protein
MGETNRSEIKEGIYKRSEKPFKINIKKTPIEDLTKLNNLSLRTGVDFPFDGDKGHVTPERIVIVPKKKEKKEG